MNNALQEPRFQMFKVYYNSMGNLIAHFVHISIRESLSAFYTKAREVTIPAHLEKACSTVGISQIIIEFYR